MAELILGVFLGINAVCDLKKREIALWNIVLFGAIGICLMMADTQIAWRDHVSGLLIGVLFLGIAAVTREGIGYGDGMVIGVCGLYLGFFKTLYLVFYALLFCSAASAVLLMRKKKTRKNSVPFVPYLLLGYGWMALF